ncbi:nucleotide exchange factor SIL1-like isoform X1 [Babylonia areolata]|uniref:nucleotide exchange factor SIL1-like isoform X1 n=1 Tax=Babylonia areolata TaxID=304850 RepID=UPI003FD59BEF
MSWIWSTVKTVHLLVLLLVCGIGFYNLNVTSEKSPPPEDKKGDNFGALTVVQDSEQQEQDDGVVIVESEDEIKIENPDPFIPTNEWQVVKPGQAIPRGLHVRLNIQTGQKEARLMQKEENGPADNAQVQDSKPTTDSSPGLVDKLDLDEVKRAVKSMKSEEFKSVDMETLRKENQFRSYEELKADMEKINADIQTDAELISNLVQQFQALVEAKEDVTPILEQLEYYLHQIDNAMLFCDLGAMPTLLRCLNSSREKVRAEAALALGSALQSNPKVQIAAIENGAMHEVLRLVAFDQSMTVRKRAMYALSTMVRHFPFAQKHFLKLGGLSVLGKLFENKLTEKLQVRAVTLLADLIKEKELHSVHSDAADSAQEERLRQYGEINLQEAMVESGWCSLISSLLVIPEHDSREKVLVAMDTVLPACEMFFQSSVPMLRNLQEEYKELVREEQEESRDGEVEGDGFYQSLVGRVERLIDMLNIKEEL